MERVAECKKFEGWEEQVVSKRIESSGRACRIDVPPQVDMHDGASKRNASASVYKSLAKKDQIVLRQV